jgi:hypothetical protein
LINRGAVELVFSKLVVQLVNAIKAVYLKPKTSMSLKAPTVLFKAIELRDALKEDVLQITCYMKRPEDAMGTG